MAMVTFPLAAAILGSARQLEVILTLSKILYRVSRLTGFAEMRSLRPMSGTRHVWGDTSCLGDDSSAVRPSCEQLLTS